MPLRQARPGAPAIYHMGKCSTCPGPRATNIVPSPRGEAYVYGVDKYWTVAAIEGEYVILVTRGGKCHRIRSDDPRLRHPTLWERWVHGVRFPRIPQLPKV